MSTATKAPKRQKYPVFSVTGLVSIYEHGSNRPDIKVQAHCYVNHQYEADHFLKRDARHRLERMGVTKERLDALFFEESEITDIHANDAKFVRRVFGERIEATINHGGMPDAKRATLIRQFRLVPWDQDEMLAIYGPKEVATAGGAA